MRTGWRNPSGSVENENMVPTSGAFRGGARTLMLVPAAILFAFSIMAGAAQRTSAASPGKEVQNPLAGDPEAIQLGRALFRHFCSFCHGLEASRGTRGPDLTRGRWTHGSSDAAIFRTISEGVPGTAMPATVMTEDEAWAIIAYLRSLSAASATPVRGNRKEGERIFFGSGGCSQCHMVNGKGGRLGPSLSRIAASRGTQYLIESIRDPNKQITNRNPDWMVAEGYETVRVVTKDGRRITGVRRNEDRFSIQLMDRHEQIHLLLKKNLQEVIHERGSLMPKYSEQMLNETELQDLLAYLDSLH